MMYQVNAAIAFIKVQGTAIGPTGVWDNRENESLDIETAPTNGLA